MDRIECLRPTSSLDNGDDQFDEKEIHAAHIQQIPVVALGDDDAYDGDRRVQREYQSHERCLENVQRMADPTAAGIQRLLCSRHDCAVSLVRCNLE